MALLETKAGLTRYYYWATAMSPVSGWSFQITHRGMVIIPKASPDEGIASNGHETISGKFHTTIVCQTARAMQPNRLPEKSWGGGGEGLTFIHAR